MNILVVEDESSIREVETTYLKRAGFAVAEADDGRRALDTFTDQHFDAVVLDLNLPGMAGLDVCRSIREISNIPILIVTAQGSDEDEVKGLEIGADDYIKKPFNPNVLVARVQTLLRRHATKELRFKRLVINPQTMMVSKDDKPITLTTTRFNLLLTLASQPGVVFSREQLVDKIYSDPAGHVVYERTIDAHVKELRKQIEDDPRTPQYVETIIGAGYRFKEPS